MEKRVRNKNLKISAIVFFISIIFILIVNVNAEDSLINEKFSYAPPLDYSPNTVLTPIPSPTDSCNTCKKVCRLVRADGNVADEQYYPECNTAGGGILDFLRNVLNPFKKDIYPVRDMMCNPDYESACKFDGKIICNAKGAERKGFNLIRGTGKYKEISAWCKNGVEIGSFVQGFPVCKNSGEVAGKEEFEIIHTSAYMVRNKNSFSLDGITFILSPSINFSGKVIINLNYSYYSGFQGDLQTYRYADHNAVLDSCDSTFVNSVSREMDAKGGEISLSDKMKITIPENAINEKTDILIEEYELSNCYIPGQNDVVREYPRQVNMFFYYFIGSVLFVLIFVMFLFYRIIKKKN